MMKSSAEQTQTIMRASQSSEMLDVYDVSHHTFDVVENQSVARTITNIATQHFSNIERLMFAITDDDVATFDRLNLHLEDLANLEFDGGTNVLNFAIENERSNIVEHLAKLTAQRPDIRKKLLEHKFR
jgi:hypothetical protein